MTDAQREKLKKIFATAVELSEDERHAYLHEACGDDAALRDEVVSLLRHDETSATGFLGDGQIGQMREAVGDVLTPRSGDTVPQSDVDQAVLPESVGDYKVVRLIGRGGMGHVYEARQQQPERRVAVKVIQPGAMSERAFRRFEHEVQVLGRLQHPGIAHIYDAGTATVRFGDGRTSEQPFFAMEYVDGESLTAYARSRSSDPAARLRLVVRVCEAIQHAHQKGVIHRDLKPANIMVDASGQPKILDFGIARSTESDIYTVTMQTDMGQVVGTLGYMSPEQVAGDSSQIDTRSDVYAIGVILYELLTNQLPHTVRSRSLADAMRSIQEDEPTRLGRVDARLRGDLETIVSKALEKDPQRRYAAASELAADVQRYLADEPIVARPPSSFYQLRKFARRHRAIVSVLVLLFVVLVGGVAVSLDQAIRARDAERVARERLAEVEAAQALAEERLDRAEAAEQLARERTVRTESALQEADAVIAFLQEMLTNADPAKTMGEALTVRALLDSASETIERYSMGMPLAEARIRRTIGKTYQMIGQYEAAVDPLASALTIQRAELGENDRATLTTTRDLARLRYLMGDLDGAQVLLDALIPTLRAQGDAHELLALSLETMGSVHRRRSEIPQAVAILEESLTLFEEHVKRDGPVARVKGELGAALMRMARYERAETLLREAIEQATREHGPESAYVAGQLSNLAIVLNRSGRPVEAEPVYEQALRIQQKLHGPEHPAAVSTLMNICMLRVDTRRYEEALELLDEAIAGAEAAHGETSFQVAIALGTKSSAMVGLNRLEEGYALSERALAIFRTVFGEQHEYIGTQLINLSNLEIKMERYAEAEKNLLAAKEVYAETVGVKHPWNGIVLEKLARVRSFQGDFDMARQHLTEALALYESTRGPNSLDVASCLATWADVEREASEFDAAVSKWERAIEIRIASPNAVPRTVADSVRKYAAALLAVKSEAEVMKIISDVLAQIRARHSPDACRRLLDRVVQDGDSLPFFANQAGALREACDAA